jgi:hypothetical protein
MSAPRMFLVDVEATGATPHSGTMTEYGVVELSTRSFFHGHLWPAVPDPANPAKALIPAGARPDPKVRLGAWVLDEAGPSRRVRSVDEVAVELVTWLGQWKERPVFVSDNPGYDFMWMAHHFDVAGMPNPFGHSSRRIGDLAAGLAGDWRSTSKWKGLRQTAHDHHPVNDCLGNAEALDALLTKHDQPR